ncbi:MAG: ATP-binding protein [Candidatus Kerfeldbacteria bacterium]
MRTMKRGETGGMKRKRQLRPQDRMIPHPKPRSEVMKAKDIRGEERERTLTRYLDSIREAETARAMVNVSMERLKEALKTIKESDNAEAVEEAKKTADEQDQLRRYWLPVFWSRYDAINEMRTQHGDSLEKAHRQQVEQRTEFVKFLMTFEELAEVEREMAHYMPPIDGFVPRTPKEHEKYAIAMEVMAEPLPEEPLAEFIPPVGEEEEYSAQGRNALDMYRFMLSEEDAELVTARDQEYYAGKREYEAATPEERKARGLMPPAKELPTTLADLKERQNELYTDAEHMWNEKYFIQKLWFERLMTDVIRQVHDKKRVLDVPSTTNYINELHAIRQMFTDTTIGGVLVGEPGVGKTTIIKHYLDKLGRKEPLEIDMSEEVTQYTLLGMPEVTLEEPIDRYIKFINITKNMTEPQLIAMIQRQQEKVKDSLQGLSEDERTAVLIGIMENEIAGAELKGTEMSEQTRGALAEIKDRLGRVAENAFIDEAAKKLQDLTKKNGWRDGIMIQALRQDRDLIVNEFNMAESWTFMHELLQKRPGMDSYRIAETGEELPIPAEWRMFFTGNVGKKHGTFAVKEALTDRIGAKAIEMDVPQWHEEYMVMLAMISNRNGRLLRNTEDVNRLGNLIENKFPEIRKEISGEQGIRPMSYRVIIDIAQQLVDRDSQCTRPTTLDQAIFRALVRPYALHERKEIPEKIVKECLEAGLLLDKKVENDVIRWGRVTVEELDEKRKDHENDDHVKMVQERREKAVTALTAQLPLTLAI